MESKILEILSGKNKSLTIMEINDLLGLHTIEEYQELEKTLNRLCMEAQIYYSEKKKRYTLFSNTNYMKGKLIVNPKGYGFVILDDNDREDIFINSRNMLDAKSNDIVLVEYINKHNKEGKVTKVIKRDESNLVGLFDSENGIDYVILDKKEYGKYIIPKGFSKGAVPGHKVLVRRLFNGAFNEAEVIKIIGHKNDVGIDILSYVYEYGFDPTYSDDVMAEVEKIPSEVSEEEMLSRTDLRDKMIFTIDGKDTKDIDDAISIEKIDNDKYILGVHIADVSHYVKKGSYLDDDAYERGTSVYLVDRVVPMLPHKLSNGICSLNPNVDRLAMSCVMEINGKGYVSNYQIFKSVIRSKKQMNYDDVNSILEDNVIPSGYEEYVDTLRTMNELSNILRKKMVRHGYIEFNIKEPKIIVDDSCHPVDIKVCEQRTGEKLIENFMIVANETVAGFIEDKNLPGIYRVHDKPNKEKLIEYLKFLSIKGYNIKADVNRFSPKDYQNIINKFKNDPARDILGTLAIQTMSKAKYSDINIGHYGIASKRYSHFTSPIRRYPDLMVHRLLREYLYNGNINNQVINYWESNLDYIANNCSLREQAAVEAEREVDDMKEAEYMESHIGEIFEGQISGVTSFGMFVELPNMIEGLVHTNTLEGDYFNYIPELFALVGQNTKKTYRLGDKVRVKCIAASKEEKTIDFIILDGDKKKNEKQKSIL